jgi:hypothetical protein
MNSSSQRVNKESTVHSGLWKVLHFQNYKYFNLLRLIFNQNMTHLHKCEFCSTIYSQGHMQI